MPEEFADAALSTDPERDLTDLLARAQIRVTTQNPALRASSECPAGTICPQVVTATNDPALHSLLARIGEQTALPVLQVEDFALRGSPVVRTEAAAVEALHRSRLDCLVVEDRIYERRAM